MPRGLTFGIQAIGAEDATEHLETIARRFENAQPAFELVERVLERGEARHFAGLRGKYVDTGALKASLTQPNANGAIREAHADELVFGTSIFYAKFQRKGKKSAVLVLKPTERRAASEVILGYITGGQEIVVG